VTPYRPDPVLPKRESPWVRVAFVLHLPVPLVLLAVWSPLSCVPYAFAMGFAVPMLGSFALKGRALVWAVAWWPADRALEILQRLGRGRWA
jgi:hypothetical protein